MQRIARDRRNFLGLSTLRLWWGWLSGRRMCANLDPVVGFRRRILDVRVITASGLLLLNREGRRSPTSEARPSHLDPGAPARISSIGSRTRYGILTATDEPGWWTTGPPLVFAVPAWRVHALGLLDDFVKPTHSASREKSWTLGRSRTPCGPPGFSGTLPFSCHYEALGARLVPGPPPRLSCVKPWAAAVAPPLWSRPQTGESRKGKEGRPACCSLHRRTHQTLSGLFRRGPGRAR